jgi:signal transduction histidine kinase
MSRLRRKATSTPWRWIAGAWAAAALFDACQTVVIMRLEGRTHPWPPLFLIEFVLWLPWALATPWVVDLALEHPIIRNVNARTVALHLAAFAAISITVESWYAWLQTLFNPWGNKRWPTFVETFSTSLVYQLLIFVIAYALILTVTYLVDAKNRITRQAMEAVRLNEQLTRAQLTALRGQLEPHFMYNTLNTIAGLVRDQRNQAAVNMVVGLSELLRRALEDSHRSEVTLAEEVGYLQRYVDIQKIRFGDRLDVGIDIPGELLQAQVPSLLLQPLVENAIKHGISRRVGGGSIRVVGECSEHTLRLTITNDGTCTQEDLDATRTGVGLDNLRSRLQLLHGDRADLVLRHARGEGVEVVVTLPLKES